MTDYQTRQIALEILIGSVLVAGALVVFAMTAQCGANTSEPAARVPDARFVTGLSYCVADVALAKAQMKETRGGLPLEEPQRAILRERYEACAHNVNELFGFDGVALDAGAGAPARGY